MPGHSQTAPAAPRSRLRAWLELLRAPNLLTVPGDAIAGYLLAAGAAAQPGPRLALAVSAALAFYAAGLVLNDVADLAEDRAARPDRPLPSGRISVSAARAAGFLLLLLGLALATLLGTRGLCAGAALALTVLGYDLILKRSIIFGPIALGLCRSLSMVLGASLVGTASRALIAASILLNAYIVIVSYLAHTETRTRRRSWISWIPALVIIGGMAAFVRVAPAAGEDQMRMAAAFFFAFLLASFSAMRLQDGRPAPAAIGLMLGALLPLQSAFSLGAGAGVWSALAGFALLVLWPLHRLLARWFHAS